MSHLLKSIFFQEEPEKMWQENETNKVIFHFCFDTFFNRFHRYSAGFSGPANYIGKEGDFTELKQYLEYKRY